MYRREKKESLVINFQSRMLRKNINKNNRFAMRNFYYSKYSEIIHHRDSVDVPRKKSSHKKRVKFNIRI